MEDIKFSFLERDILAGEVIKPWLILGPFYKDFSDRVRGLSLFERPGSLVGRDVMNEVLEEAKKILFSSPYEGLEASFLGENGRWNLVRNPEKYLSWGRYNISNHLGAIFLSTIIIPKTLGKKEFRLFTFVNSRILVAINNNIVFDTDSQEIRVKDRRFEYRFDAYLNNEENIITLAVFRLARMTQMGFWLELLNEDLKAYVPIKKDISSNLRAQIEKEVNSIRLERYVFYPEDDIGVLLDKTQIPSIQLRIQLKNSDGKVISESIPQDSGKVILCSGKDLPNGRYEINCIWEDKEKGAITNVTLDISRLEPTPPLIGYERLEERKRIVLRHFADNPQPGRDEIWSQVARYALGEYDKIDEQVIRDTCEFIRERKDCSDFVIQAILRLMYWERETPRLKPEIRALMKDTILGFKYWVDEPGDTVMYMGSENHRLLFHVAEWLAGQLFPTEEFTNSHQNGLYHAMKGRMFITEWLRQRGRFGFDEWHSNSYYPVNIAPLINVYDFAIYEDSKLRLMAKQILDYIFFVLASDTFHGIFGTTHGRSYGINLTSPDYEGTASVCWLLYGEGSLWGGSGMAPVSVATSKYKLPEILAKIANDHSTVVESYQRHGFSEEKEPSANFVVYRTPDYMLSGLQDYEKGAFSPQIHVAQVTLEKKAVIFWSCPHTSSEGGGLRPDYWSGNTTLPRVIQYRNVLALAWRQNELSWMTHCFFEPARFDEVRFDGKWVFARVNHGYVGIYSQHGMEMGRYGKYAGRELVCYAPNNIWIVECGRETDWGSFDRFVETLKGTQVIEDGEKLVYISPSIGEFVVGWDIEPTVKGNRIKLKDYPLIDSVWAHSDFGSGYMLIRYGDDKLELWFNQ